jgi:hypothetical protein
MNALAHKMSGAAELQKYEYRPLREGPNNIRLIQILPGVGDAGIVCQVFQYTLRNDKAFGLYESLSYVWGNFDNPHDILVRNAEDSEYRTFKVTHNLYTALRRLRDPDLPRTFWIDAICINQHDLQERALQVTIMARIYAYATSVSVWLGEADNDSSAMFDLLQDILTQRSKHSPGWERSIESKVVPAADGVQALLDRAWFRRAWVLKPSLLMYRHNIDKRAGRARSGRCQSRIDHIRRCRNAWCHVREGNGSGPTRTLPYDKEDLASPGCPDPNGPHSKQPSIAAENISTANVDRDTVL